MILYTEVDEMIKIIRNETDLRLILCTLIKTINEKDEQLQSIEDKFEKQITDLQSGQSNLLDQIDEMSDEIKELNRELRRLT